LTAIMYVVLLIAGYTPTLYNLQFFLYCPLMFLFFLGLSWITAPLSVFSRDFENLVNSILTMLFWMSGVLWDSYSVAGTWLNRIMLLNPINFIVNGYRKTFLYGEWFWQRSFEASRGTIRMTDALWENVIFVAELILVLALGAYNYNRTRKTMPDIL
ncbi:MAG: ABC transporter permease, partial [Clostridia bacterium]|nr:ABC transporter permease [Clostridia bacterium]